MSDLINALWMLGGLVVGGCAYFIIADHFDNKDKPQPRKPLTHDELVKVMLQNEEVYKALAEYELNKSTGEVQRVDHDGRH